jgi:hypothetical protein
MDIMEIWLQGVIWVKTDGRLGPVLASCNHINEPSGPIRVLFSFSRRILFRGVSSIRLKHYTSKIWEAATTEHSYRWLAHIREVRYPRPRSTLVTINILKKINGFIIRD